MRSALRCGVEQWDHVVGVAYLGSTHGRRKAPFQAGMYARFRNKTTASIYERLRYSVYTFLTFQTHRGHSSVARKLLWTALFLTSTLIQLLPLRVFHPFDGTVTTVDWSSKCVLRNEPSEFGEIVISLRKHIVHILILLPFLGLLLAIKPLARELNLPRCCTEAERQSRHKRINLNTIFDLA